jgi:3-oxoacyl-(acyl-carrier-protein) synthase
MELMITSYCRIKNKSIFVNGKELSLPKEDTASYFLAQCYKSLEINYPKFHKMDNLCKLGLIAAEAVLKDQGFLQRNELSKIAVIMANRASSLDTDRQHQQSINDKEHYLPSPATFVYTLPNIVIGEIAIKYKITGENAFFVTENFDAQLLKEQAELCLAEGTASAAISGWADYDNGHTDALIYLVEKVSDSTKNTNFKALNEENLNNLYK